MSYSTFLKTWITKNVLSSKMEGKSMISSKIIYAMEKLGDKCLAYDFVLNWY